MKSILCTLLVALITISLRAQFDVEYVGLADRNLTSMDINYGILAVGTDRNGVYWQNAALVTETGWNPILLDSTVLTVYPHKSGPIGWAISAGIQSIHSAPPFVFCSYLGEKFEPGSDGIDPTGTTRVSELDGFPDPTICGETYAVTDRILYRRFYLDTTWLPVYTATFEGALETVKVRQEYPGVVLAGGSDGFAGILLVKSLDFGESWENISPFGMIQDIDFSGFAADTIFATASNRIFLTTDGGANWTTIYEDSLGFHLSEILYSPVSQTLYAAGSHVPDASAVLLMSHDLGMHWEQVPLPDHGPVLGLEDGNDGWIYFITRDEGLYRLREMSSGVDTGTGEETMVSLQNTPNPFRQKTTIAYSLAADAHVSIRIVSSTGSEIITLVNAQMSRGTHVIEWDATQESAGIYFITAEAKGHRMTCMTVKLR